MPYVLWRKSQGSPTKFDKGYWGEHVQGQAAIICLRVFVDRKMPQLATKTMHFSGKKKASTNNRNNESLLVKRPCKQFLLACARAQQQSCSNDVFLSRDCLHG